VSASEAVRAALAAALRDRPEFDVVSVTASESEASESAEIVVVATTQDVAPPVSHQNARDASVGIGLSNREREILALLAAGLGNKQIAARLGISTNTVKTHLELLFDKLGVSNRAEAVAVGIRRGLLMV
jgi:DNA-binding CsgD family transcriptional regulator